jgi:hypothetical protein
MKVVCAAVAIFICAQQQKPNPDLKYLEKAGISVMKPPKNDEWDFKEKGFWTQSAFALSHKVDEISFDVRHLAPQPNTSGFDLKKVAEDSFNNIGSQEGFTDAKRIAMNQTKMPGSGYNAWYLEMTFKRADKLTEWRQWSFVGKENQQLFMISLHCDEGMYKKHQKVADWILSNIRTWKIPKN